MKKAKNEPLKSHSKHNNEFNSDGKARRAVTPPKQKKPLSIYDDFDEEEEIEEYLNEEEDDEPDSIWDYVDYDDEDEL